MQKLFLFAMVMVVGSCSRNSLQTGGTGGHGGNAGSSGSTGGTTSLESGGTSGHGGNAGSGGSTGGTTSLQSGGADGHGGNAGSGGGSGGAAGGTGGTNPCPEGEILCSVCGRTQCAAVCSTVVCAGGATGTGGLTGSGGAHGSGGATSSPDAGIDGRRDGAMDIPTDMGSVDGLLTTDAAGSSCENPLPLRCGDRLNHSTLVQGRADVWSTYACTQRMMSGREAIYAIQPPTACQVSVQLVNPSADLDIFLLQSCSFMSCTALYGPSNTFPAGPGQPQYLVVDGYNGSAGSYTLEVDCACNQDGGTLDAPPADVPSNTADALGCDPAAATTALSALGIVTAGNPEMLSATLPAVLATDANWGLKATVCQQAGYDITALAGKTVCLLGQDMAQTCQGIPATAWVVMNNGVVACVYKTVREGLGTARGVYAANDASCNPVAIAPGATVSCDGRSCTNATGPCCPATAMMSRVGMCSPGCSVAVTCDGPEDCSNGTVCCSLEAAAGLAGASCVSAAQCTAPSRVICHQQTDCLATQSCAAPNPMPASITTGPYAESTSWRVSYQVCSP